MKILFCIVKHISTNPGSSRMGITILRRKYETELFLSTPNYKILHIFERTIKAIVFNIDNSFIP